MEEAKHGYVEVWKCEDEGAWQCGSVEVWKCGSVEVWKVEVWKCGTDPKRKPGKVTANTKTGTRHRLGIAPATFVPYVHTPIWTAKRGRLPSKEGAGLCQRGTETQNCGFPFGFPTTKWQVLFWCPEKECFSSWFPLFPSVATAKRVPRA